MFTRLIHLVMCLTVLACPALGGVCCRVTEDATVAVDVCERHCGCDPVEHEEAPVAPDCPEPCRDCFCAGALPSGFGASVELHGAVDISAVGPMEDLAVATSTQRLECSLRDESSPHGRMLLTSYCRFLL